MLATVQTPSASASASAIAALQVIRRNGAVVAFNADKIAIAMSKAFLAVEGSASGGSARVREIVARLTDTVLRALTRRLPDGGTVSIEDIQDQVELALMRSGEHDVARAYVLYRERRAAERAAGMASAGTPTLHVLADGRRIPLDTDALLRHCEAACAGLGNEVSARAVLDLALRNLYDNVPLTDVDQALILAARSLIEREPAYNRVTAQLLLASLAREVLGQPVSLADLPGRYALPAGVSVDETRRLYVVDQYFAKVDVIRRLPDTR